MKCSFIWWNTSLSPSIKKNRATAQQKDFVCTVVDNFANTIFADFIALGEVSKEDIDVIEQNCHLGDYDVVDGVEKAGSRSNFDTCILYRNSNLLLVEKKIITFMDGSSALRAAQRFDFINMHTDDEFHIFVSHWPSRKFEEGKTQRIKLAGELRREVDEVFLNNSNRAYMLFLGDYNDEPFNVSLSEILRTTRDRSLARKGMSLLYNPFWRKLGHAEAYKRLEDGPLTSGSSFYSGGKTAKWKTFDQVIFSPSFLGGSDWHIDEDNTQYLIEDALTDQILDKDQIFDHYPVIGMIEKVVN